MTTVHMPPIDDLYADTQDDREERWARETRQAMQTHPRGNGDLDEEAVIAGEHRLEQVLGW